MSSRPSLLSQNSANRRREPSFPSLQTTKTASNTAATSPRGAWGSSAPSPAAETPSFSSAVNRSSKAPSLSLTGFGSSHKPANGTGPKANDTKTTSSIHPLKYTWDVSFSHRSAIDGRPGRKKEEISRGSGAKGETSEDWRGGLVNLGQFSSIESLHPFLSHLTPSSGLPASISSSAILFNSRETNESGAAPTSSASSNFVSDLNVFRSPIQPAWEDSHNTGGGRWVLRMRKGVADRVWEEIVWALVGERIGTLSETTSTADDRHDTHDMKVNGIVLSVRKEEDILSVWCAPTNRSDRDLIRESVRLALQPLLSPTALSNLQIDYKPHPANPQHNSNSHGERGENSTTTRSSLTNSSQGFSTGAGHTNSRTERNSDSPRHSHSHHHRANERSEHGDNSNSSSHRERNGERNLRTGSGFSSYVSRRGERENSEGKERVEGESVPTRGFGRTRRTSLSKGEHAPPMVGNGRWAA